MRDKPWAVIDVLDDTAATEWFATQTEAEVYAMGKPVVIQYRPGRKGKVKKNA